MGFRAPAPLDMPPYSCGSLPPLSPCAWTECGGVFSSWHSQLHLYVLWSLRQSMHS